MKTKLAVIPLLFLLIGGCSHKGNITSNNINNVPTNVKDMSISPNNDYAFKNYLVNKYKNQTPKLWGEDVPGVYRHEETNNKVIALTFDACGGPKGSGYDKELINYLRQMKIPATLFINSRWIDANYWTFWALNRIPQFEIENHGYLHKPLSVNGKSAWGIKGTQNVGEVVDEVLLNHRKLQQLTGKTPKFFRSGTAYYDEVAVKVLDEIGERPVGYSVLGDAGATYNREQVKNALLSAKPGSIVIMHMNHPEGQTFEGVKDAIPILIQRGYRFVKLTEFPLQ
jgi:peptidoglycan/xylan/chitin deacetylase (PgdA/CDA1 family)